MFEWQYCLRYDRDYDRRPRKSVKKGLAIFLVCILVLLTCMDPITTFSRYVVNLQEDFSLNTSNFYFNSSLDSNMLTFDRDEGFTPGNNLTVANYSDSSITTDNISYTITLEENCPTPIFDLYIEDGAGGKTICSNNTINSSLSGGSSHINNHMLYFGLKDSSTPAGTYPAIITLTSSEPYIRSYNFSVNIQVESSLILIEGTEDIYRPDVEIPEGEIMVFKDEQYAYLTPADLVSSQVVIDEVVENMERPELIGGSLYVPASIGDLSVQANQTIDWDVYGHIVLEPDIAIYNQNISVNMLSHNGDVIMNGVSMTGGSSNPYVVDIVAENGGIEASGTEISSKADGNGKINLMAEDDINLSGAHLESAGDYGINIQSTTEGINAEGTAIVSTNGSPGAAVILQSAGPINLDGATVQSASSGTVSNLALLIKSTSMGISALNATITSTSKSGDANLIMQSAESINLDEAVVSGQVALTISSVGDISARAASITNSAYGKNINIASSDGLIDLSSLAASDTEVSSSNGSVYITAHGDISIIAARISASTSLGMELSFESTGSDSILWAEDADLTGKTIIAQNLVVNGVPASGTITLSGP